MREVTWSGQVTQSIRVRDGIALQQRGEVTSRIVAATDASDIGSAWLPEPLEQRSQRAREPALARIGNCGGLATERRNRQHPIGLAPDPQRRQWAERTHVRDEML